MKLSAFKNIGFAILALVATIGAAFGNDLLHLREGSFGGIVSRPSADARMEIHGHYIVRCVGADGQVKWSESFDNLVTTVGKNDMLDKYLAGTTWTTGTVYMMLKGTGTAAAGDTMSSHAGWSELNASASSGARQSVSFSAASSGSKATSAAVAWSITGSATVAGVAIVIGGTSTNANTTGVLFSVGDFGAPRSVVNGDTLNVTYSASL